MVAPTQNAIVPAGAPDLSRALAKAKDDKLQEVSANTARAYEAAWQEFLTWLQAQPRRKPQGHLQRYRDDLRARGLKASTIQQRVSAVRALISQAAINGDVPPGLPALLREVKVKGEIGDRLHRWLSRQEAQRLIEAPGLSSKKGLRDTCIIGCMLGTGLRRSEVAGLTWGHIRREDDTWCFANVKGKHERVRTVAMPDWLHVALMLWAEADDRIDSARSGDPIFWAVQRGDKIPDNAEPGLSAQAIWRAVEKWAKVAKIKPLPRPHDLRRTFARRYYECGGQLRQLQLMLGHASIETTERYIGANLRLSEARPDRFLDYGLSLH